MPGPRPQRAAARKASAKLQTQDASPVDDDPDSDSALSSPPPSSLSSTSDMDSPPPKRQKPSTNPRRRPGTTTKTTTKTTTTTTTPRTPTPTTLLPRHHPPTYHTPLLLTSPSTRAALLTWFTAVSSHRAMPWRRPFLPPHTTPSPILAQRAYEVYISEIMLQQTRVATVISYWTAWMARFPTLAALADADEDDVLAAWRGLGYYSRARRIHAAARMCRDTGLPDTVEGLVRVPGVGRYTAGAVAAIVFGRGEAMVDGNVVRVLVRQMGVWGEGKGVEGRVWEAAGGLVRAVVEDGGEERGERAGLWGQALMELGSTVCTPKRPGCGGCPIRGTCRVYEEGERLARGEGLVRAEGLGDIEDCGVCVPFEGDEGGVDGKGKGKGVSPFFVDEAGEEARRMEIIVNHAQKFPLRKPKKKVREEETLVCAVRRVSDGAYLIHRRPDKGMLAGLWELPSLILPSTNDSKAEARKIKAMEYVASLVDGRGKAVKGKRKRDTPSPKHVADLGSVPWLFSHLKLTMHVQLFELDGDVGEEPEDDQRRWASAEEVEQESMGTGMRKCWALVQEHG
ncbi:A/G-specific adenine DNA glycosylase [Podospora conica]|nr:A/G-specific adenine DNA glycosylase [Schizothecium conicum]